MESSASKCNRALPSAIEPICFGAQLRERYTLKSDIYQLSVLIARGFARSYRGTGKLPAFPSPLCEPVSPQS